MTLGAIPKIARHILLAAILVAVAVRPSLAADHNTLTADEAAAGWLLLFDGESLFGWQPASKADWKVNEGAIVVSSGEPGLLNTTTRFADYVLRVDFRAAKATNSGVFLRTEPKPKNPKEGCYELNIAPFGSTPFATGSLVARGEKAKVAQNLDGDGERWQSFEVTCDGPRIAVSVDGKSVLDYKEEIDPKAPRIGHVGLQLNSGKVEFRNIKLRPLGLKPQFNGKDLSGWHTSPELKPAFAVEDGVLRVKGGKGQLESDQKFGNFVASLTAKANAARTNSGLFFRSIPGEIMNGYECQLQNAYGVDDKPNPVDCGTGGICRRQIARKLVAKDNEWFRVTLIADGPHMATWVNGYPTCDFVDKRKPHANPRNGLRTDAGTLILQSHDDTTDFSFREILASELPQ